MNVFVLDASLAMEWFTQDASTSATRKRVILTERAAIVPALWRYEVMNVLTTWQRRGDITGAHAARILRSVLTIPTEVVDDGGPEAIVNLAQARRLSAYDATYLRVAMLLDAPLATMDRVLTKAAKAEGIECL